jgi:iron complex outermembrane receptor protein
MNTRALATYGVSALALLLASAPGAAKAQTTTSATPSAPSAAADNSLIGEVVVTTRRSSENVQSVPLAITVTTADQLQSRGITDLQGLAQFTPGLSFKDFVTSFHGNPTIRGMAQINTANPVTNVGVFVDGVNLQRDYQVNVSLGDFERIEVVKGPQSALYGSNTFAGAINYVTKKPTDFYTGDAEVTGGNAGTQRLQAAVGGPIIKGLLDARIYVGSDKYGGTIANNLPGVSGSDSHFNRHDREAQSVALKFTPLSNVTIGAYYTHTTKSENIAPFYTVSGKFVEDKTNCGVTNTATGRPELYCGEFSTNPAAFRTGVGNHPSGLYSNIEPNALGQNDLMRVSADWDINSAFSAHYTFGSTRGSASEDFSFFSNGYNPTVGPGSTTFSQQIEGGKIFYTSHEARLNYDAGKPYKFELGYFHSDADDRYFLGTRSIPITGGIIAPFTRTSDDALVAPAGTIFLQNLHESFKVDAVFGRGSFSFLGDRANVGAELRYTRTSLNFIDVNYTLTHPTAAPLASTYNDPAPRFTAEYKLTPQNLLYASAAEGIKTGGFNGYTSGTLTLLPSEQSFGEEKNWTYEFGAKNSFLDHKLLLNADVFYIDWTNKQSSLAPSNLPPNTTGALTTVANIYKTTGAATNYGIEIDGMYRPIMPLTFNFSYSAQNPRYSSGSTNTAFVGYCTVGTCPVDGSIGGNVLERQSKYSGAFSGEYRDHLTSEWDYFGGGDVTYQSKQFTDQENLGFIAPHTLVNARLGFETRNWKVFVWGKNIFDTLYVDNVFYTQSQQQYTAAFGERRTFGVTAAGKF